MTKKLCNDDIYTISSNMISSDSLIPREVLFYSGEDVVMKIHDNGDVEFKNGFKITADVLESLINGKSFLVSKCDDDWYVNNEKADDVDGTIASEIAKRCLTEDDIKLEEIIQINREKHSL